MSDSTEDTRRKLVQEINADPGSREALEAEHGQVWDTQQLREDFEVLGFGAPLVVVRRDGQSEVPAPASVLLQVRTSRRLKADL